MTSFLSMTKRTGFAIFIVFSIVFPAVFTQAAAPLTLKTSAAESPKKQTASELPSKAETPPAGGAFGVKQINPFRKETPQTSQNVEKQPNIFQELLDSKIELPTKKRPPAPPKKAASKSNLFDEFKMENPFDGGVRNPFEDAEAEMDNPFDGGVRNPFEDAEMENSHGEVSDPFEGFEECHCIFCRPVENPFAD